MKRYIVRAGYVVISFVMLVMTIAAVCRVKSYQNVGTNIGGFSLTGKEITINTKNGEARKIDTGRTDIFTTWNNDLYLITGDSVEYIESDSVKSVDADNLSLVFKSGHWCSK